MKAIIIYLFFGFILAIVIDYFTDSLGLFSSLTLTTTTTTTTETSGNLIKQCKDLYEQFKK